MVNGKSGRFFIRALYGLRCTSFTPTLRKAEAIIGENTVILPEQFVVLRRELVR
jgi:hypothetical protein